MTDAKKKIESLAAQADDIPVRGQPVAQRHNAGKPDLTLIPWNAITVFSYTTVSFILPAFAWYRRALDTEHALNNAIAVWNSAGRDLFVDAAAALNYGANKYAAYNWELGFDEAKTVYASMCRHLYAMTKGELVDPESGLEHQCHLAFGYLAMFKLQSDGRPEAPQLTGKSNPGPVEIW